MRLVSLIIAGVVAAFATMLAPPPGRAGTPYEAQIGGFMVASLETIVRGEFSGHKDSNIDAEHTRRVCRPVDYDDLRATAGNRAAFINFHRRCRLVEFTTDRTHAHATAYLPAGSCEPLKVVYLRILNQHVFAEPGDGHSQWVSFDHKGAHYGATRRTLARGAQLQATCLENGALRISAPRERARAPKPASAYFAEAYGTLLHVASRPTTIIFALAIAVFAQRWKWALVGAGVFATFEYLALVSFVTLVFGKDATPRLSDVVALVVWPLPYLGWVSALFAIKQLMLRVFRPTPA